MKYVIVIFILLAAGLSRAALTQKQLDSQIRRSDISRKYIGMWIQGPDGSLEINGEKLMTPASLSKIATAGAALEYHGLEHQFLTQILYTGKIRKGVLKGDLFLKGGGDPSLVSENFWAIVNEFKRSGITQITGSIYVDDFLFDDVRFSQTRPENRVHRAYDAPVGAMSFNWNTVNVYVRPSGKIGSKAQVFLDPKNDFVVLENKSKTGRANNIRVRRVQRKNFDVIEVTGTISQRTREKAVYASISRPALWAGYNFKAFLKQQDILQRGVVLRKKTPAKAQLLVEHKSKPLREVVADMSKFSNNYVAEMLAKSLSKDKPSRLPSGVQEIQKWLVTQGLKPENFVFSNPSGFSKKNKFRAKDLGAILVSLRSRLSSSPEFVSSLPIAGVDGTLKKRLRNLKYKVRAKTGFLSGVVGLAGYYEKNNQVYTFVMMYNGPRKYEQEAKPLFDQILTRL